MKKRILLIAVGVIVFGIIASIAWFSKKFGWVSDKFGVSWQLTLPM
jgi:predicted 3-demethylubiquinone-9 3-methyltransferase (glyoxalase superfamily)